MKKMTNKVYLLTEHNEVYQKLMAELDLPELEITDKPCEASILLASPPLAVHILDDFPSLEWIQSVYAGVDALASTTSDNFLLTNVKGIFGQQISEYVFGYLIQHFRHLPHYREAQCHSRWQPKNYSTLDGLTMLTLGTGSIASHLAKVAQAFGIKIIGINRSGIPAINSPFDETYHIQELNSVLRRTDIIVNTLPSTPQTYHILNENSLSQCTSALLFNVGRGNAVCENGLIGALQNRSVQHAFLDVFEQEPLDESNPIWHHPNITITPHIAALSFPDKVIGIFAENYQRWRDGFALINQVDLTKGY
ncbi:D-2-hydroxyacid dehydrogenase [Vibrio pectenicida]|uniref:D-2-hydroxyacid dehydrogenase n=1 Tax=Vibrio pectenicida TaxID=62763 RepID=A0A427U2W9_9VIBR|nr:D-2-hydroxyacid dehydrogenase [Vibrio pectenicida]NOH70519.1 D-2-hydroxyacid dehydrogenase [Vibrio pectenicida]RSD30965.1 D-2-hydroxyacid dehydrogenase [Vibrio pectenicida]